jgi:hypothetical protein
MKQDQDWSSRYHREIRRASLAHSSGNEGMARVCARRAAGVVIEEFLIRQNLDYSHNVYQNLQLLIDLPEVKSEIRLIAQHLLLRVKSDFSLPINVDLIEEAKLLAHELVQIET